MRSLGSGVCFVFLLAVAPAMATVEIGLYDFSLGSAALTVRGARTVWSHLIAEGAAVEDWLRRTLGGAADPEAGG